MHTATLFSVVTLLAAGLINAYDPVKMLCLVNKERTRSGLKPLGMSQQLQNAAQKHSNDQARMRSMTHSGSDGSSPGDRVERAGYNWRSVAENVAYGYGDEEECMRQWMNSSGHRKNILGRDYTHFGSAVGYAGSTPYYTQDFGGDGKSHNFPECPSGGSYGDSGGNDNSGSDYSGDQGGNDSGSDNYGSSAPSKSYSGGGGSAPSKPSKSYGGRSPSTNYRPSKPSGSYNTSPSYGGGRSPSKSRKGRKMTSYGGNVSDKNDKPSSYGGDVSDDSDQQPSSYGGGSKKPAYGAVDYNKNNKSHGNKQAPAYGRRNHRHSRGRHYGHSRRNGGYGGHSSGGY
jgi:hypothetical protein